MENKPPLLTVRPHFDQGLTTLQAILFTLIGFLLVTIVLGTFVFILFSIIGLTKIIPAGYIYGLFLVGSIVVLPPLFFEMKKKAYARTVYHFHDDHVDFQYFQFFISMRRGRIRYRDISDVTQQANALQEQRRLTNVYLYVPSMAYNARAFAGIKISDVPMRQDTMTRIMDMIENSENRDMARAAGMMAAPAAVPPAAVPPVTPLTDA